MTTSQAATKPGDTSRRTHSAFRLDIQGLRAIAVSIVVLYHLWPKRLHGGFVGVDVFFVISGFLITQHLVSKPPRSLRDLGAFWARRIRRLLPASLLVILVTLVAALLLAPATTWHDTGVQGAASALYVQNWVLAFSSVDYLAADNAPTALQHFWSLSVEEQFYFIWPLVVAALVAFGVARRRLAATLKIGLAVLVAVGLVFSIWYTDHNLAMAYFVTTTRLWELAAGGLTAVLVLGRSGSYGAFSSVLAWAGLAGIAVAAFTTDPAAPFPGTAAILPVLSTALVLGANASGFHSPSGLLGLRPVQFVGNTSYSIYLWHWPLVVLVPNISGTLTWPVKLCIIAASMLLAWGTMRWVEQRFRRFINGFSLTRVFVATALVMALVAGTGWGLARHSDTEQAAAQQALSSAEADPTACIGAAALEPNAAQNPACASGQPLLLDAVAAKSDRSDAYPDGCWSNQPFNSRPTCTYGSGKTHVALIGNSHAGHWLPALQRLAKDRDWTITTFLVSRCTVNSQPQVFTQAEATGKCQEYGKWVQKQTTSGKFDAVVTSERQSVRIQDASWDETEARSAQGYKDSLMAWHKAGVPVVVLRDTPFPGAKGINVPDCVAANEDDLSACTGTPDSWHWMDPLADETKKLGFEDQHVIQTDQWLCPDGTCEPVIGRVVTYFDDSHLTATYARTLAPAIGRELDKLNVKGV